MPGSAPRASAFQLLTGNNRGAGIGPLLRQGMHDIHRGAHPLEVLNRSRHGVVVVSRGERFLGDVCSPWLVAQPLPRQQQNNAEHDAIPGKCREAVPRNVDQEDPHDDQSGQEGDEEANQEHRSIGWHQH